MDSHELLIASLRRLPSKVWINQYFDLLKKILTELQLENDDPRMGLSLTKSKWMPANLGQRYILKPYTNKYIGIIVPANFEEESAFAETIFKFKANNIIEAKFIQFIYNENADLSEFVYDACIESCKEILHKTKRTGYRKYHEPLLYHFTMESAVRNEILRELD